MKKVDEFTLMKVVGWTAYVAITVIVLVMLFSAREASAMTINVTSDIHAGKAKVRDYTSYTPGNVIYPKKWGGAFDNFLATPADVYVALGDNTNTCKDSKYAKKIKAKVDKSGKQVLFGFGNHECDNGYKYLNNGNKYYTVDKGNVRIIVLNTEEVYYNTDGQNDGGLSPAQLSWLSGQLNTTKDVVIMMSKPPYKKDMVTRKAGYAQFFQIVEGSGNVKHIFGGDYHIRDEVKTYNGIKYHFVPALTLKGNGNRFHQVSL